MTWAEFQIRSFGFKRVQKWQKFLIREIAYEVHCNRYIWGKKKPPKKNDFWPLDEKKNSLNDAHVSALEDAWKKYKDGKS